MIELLNGNALHIPLADKSVQCVITSPPFFGLRDYGTAKWMGGEPGCDHKKPGATKVFGNPEFNKNRPSREATDTVGYRDTCGKCGAVRIDSQIGLEKSPAEYVKKLVTVFREVKRVLRDDGVVFLNLGDSYNGSGKARGNGGVGPKSTKQLSNHGAYFENENPVNHSDFKPKDRMGIPHRVVFALQADGWWWRDEVVWHKPNPMPSSVTDRTTCAHEFVFMLTKSKHYYYDNIAIAEPSIDPESYAGRRKRNSGQMDRIDPQNYKFHGSVQEDGTLRYGQTYPTRNRRSVWTITPEQFHGAHFAAFPQALVEPMILAGTSPQACNECRAPWGRIVEIIGLPRNDKRTHSTENQRQGKTPAPEPVSDGNTSPIVTTIGWQPTCSCPNNTGSGHCIVLDPFAGSGTVGRVCIKHKRSFVGLELKPEYIDLARKRTSNVPVVLMENM